MKVKIQDIVDAINFNSEQLEHHLNLKTGEVCCFTEEELCSAENEDEIADSAEWYREAVERAKVFLENQKDYLELPGKYEFNEYRIIEKFIAQIDSASDAEKLYSAIKGKGAFRRFKQNLERLALLDGWYEFKGTKLREFAESWCQENEISYE